MSRLFVFGLGYTAARLTERLRAAGWTVEGTGRHGTIDFADQDAVRAALRRANHVLSSVPPAEENDPVLAHYGEALGHGWLGYLSSAGVYGDLGGAWVDESAPVGGGRRSARAACDGKWLARRARVFRLPGIYGPGRSALERMRAGTAHRIDLPDHVFSRVHVDDVVRAVELVLQAPPGAYNIADDRPTSANAVVEEACRLLGVEPPPLQTIEQAGLSQAARGFYAENRRVANGKAKRVLGWAPRYPDYRTGLRALKATSIPNSPSAAPPAASGVQR